jgi:hypothetical protein
LSSADDDGKRRHIAQNQVQQRFIGTAPAARRLLL